MQSLFLLRRRYATASAALVLSLALNSYANIAYAAERAVPMPEIGSVSVTRAAGIDHGDESTTVMTRAQIEAAPATGVDQILNKIPGIFTPQIPANQLHPTSQIISIRGFGSAFGVKTLVLLDGVPLNDGYFRTIDWARVPKDSLERIEVIRGGGATSLWGNLALGGVINLVSRAPRPHEQTFDVSYGGYNTWNENISSTLASGKIWRVRGDLSAASSAGYNLIEPRYRNPGNSFTGSHANNASLTSFYQPSNKTRLTAKLEVHDAQQSGLVWSSAGNRWMHNGFRIGGSTDLSRKAKLNGYAWYDNGLFITRNVATPGYTLAAPATGTQYLAQAEGLTYQTSGASLYYGNGNTLVGSDYRNIDADDNNTLFSATGTTTAQVRSQGGHRFQGIFAQGLYHVPKTKADVTLGLREDFWQTQNGSLRGATQAGTLNTILANQRFARFDPRLGLTYKLAPGLHLRALGYRNFSAPGMNQMYRSFVSGTSYTNTSPGLQPETNAGFEGGVDIEHAYYNLHVTAFDNSVKNYIDFPTLCTTTAACAQFVSGTGLSGISTVRQYLNVGNARIKGLEFLGDVRLGPKIRMNAGFTRTLASLTTTGYPTIDPVGNQLGGVPPYVFLTGFEWTPDARSTVSLQLKQFAGYYGNTAHTIRNDSAAIADLSASYKLNSGVSVYTVVQNVTNSVYRDMGSSGNASPAQLGAPFNVLVGLRGSF